MNIIPFNHGYTNKQDLINVMKDYLTVLDNCFYAEKEITYFTVLDITSLGLYIDTVKQILSTDQTFRNDFWQGTKFLDYYERGTSKSMKKSTSLDLNQTIAGCFADSSHTSRRVCRRNPS